MGQDTSSQQPQPQVLPGVAQRFAQIGGDNGKTVKLGSVAQILSLHAAPAFLTSLIKPMGFNEELTVQEFSQLHDKLTINVFVLCYETFAAAEGLDKDGFTSILRGCMAAALEAGADIEADDIASTDGALAGKVITSLEQALFDQKTHLTQSEFKSWCDRHCLVRGLSTWCRMQLSCQPGPPFHLPSTQAAASCCLNQINLWQLSAMLPSLYFKTAELAALYNSRENGANRFQHHCFKYKGPTITIVKTQCGRVFGCALDVEWRESERPYGGTSSYLFTLEPAASVYPAELAFGNTKSRHLEHGIGFGPKPTSKETADLWLEADFSKGRLRFAPGLARGTYFDFVVNSVEVWGCADSDVADAQREEQRRARRLAAQRQKVKLPGQWDQDRSFLAMAGIGTEARMDVSRRD